MAEDTSRFDLAVIGGGMTGLALACAAAGAGLEVLCDGADFLPDIGWHPDGSRITLPGRDGQIYVLDAVGGQQPQLFPGQPADRHNSGNCWTPDGKSLIFVSAP